MQSFATSQYRSWKEHAARDYSLYSYQPLLVIPSDSSRAARRHHFGCAWCSSLSALVEVVGSGGFWRLRRSLRPLCSSSQSAGIGPTLQNGHQIAIVCGIRRTPFPERRIDLPAFCLCIFLTDAPRYWGSRNLSSIFARWRTSISTQRTVESHGQTMNLSQTSVRDAGQI